MLVTEAPNQLRLADLAAAATYGLVDKELHIPVTRTVDDDVHASPNCEYGTKESLDVITVEQLLHLSAETLCDCPLAWSAQYDQLRQTIRATYPALVWVDTATRLIEGDEHGDDLDHFRAVGRPSAANALLEDLPAITFPAKLQCLAELLVDDLEQVANTPVDDAKKQLLAASRRRLVETYGTRPAASDPTANPVQATILDRRPSDELAAAMAPAVRSALLDVADDTHVWVLAGAHTRVFAGDGLKDRNAVQFALRAYTDGPAVDAAGGRFWSCTTGNNLAPTYLDQGTRPVRIPATILVLAYHHLGTIPPYVITTRDDVTRADVVVAVTAAAQVDEPRAHDWDTLLDAAKVANTPAA